MASTGVLASAPLRLPCGVALRNRLVKSAMTEKMAVDGQPTADHQRIYKRWATGGWGALITGENCPSVSMYPRFTTKQCSSR